MLVDISKRVGIDEELEEISGIRLSHEALRNITNYAGEEINKQPIIMIRYERIVLGHTPIKVNFNAVRSNVMNLLYFHLMRNSCWEEAPSL